MYRGFNIDLDEIKLNCLMPPTSNNTRFQRLSGRSHSYMNSDDIREALAECILSEKTIDVQHLKKEWFPQIHVDIFLSHSHRDISLAKQFAHYLNVTFNLTTFIDSEVWGYSDELVNMLMDDACYDKGEYRKIIAHVNIMLASALTQMIDRTECLMFLNTENSMRSMTCTNRALTDSAWMYHELFVSSLLPKKKPHRHSKTAMLESVEILHTLPLDHLTYLDASRLHKWSEGCKIPPVFNRLLGDACQGQKTLDKLYQMYPEDRYES